MRSCLNAVTTGKPRDLVSWLEVAGKYHFAGVEFSIHDLRALVEHEGPEAALRLQRSTGVALAAFGLPVEWQADEARFRAGMDTLPGFCRAAAAAGCTRATTYIRPFVESDPAVMSLVAIRRLRAVCEVLGMDGIRLAIEWVGTPSLRRGKTPFLWTAEHAIVLCDAIGLPNAGLLFDSWHWFTTGADAQDLTRVPAGRIVHLHVNDAPNIPLSEQQDNVRLLPGASGVIDLVTMLGTLEDRGYDGYVAVETFSKELPLLGVDEAAARAKAAMDTVARKLASARQAAG